MKSDENKTKRHGYDWVDILVMFSLVVAALCQFTDGAIWGGMGWSMALLWAWNYFESRNECENLLDLCKEAVAKIEELRNSSSK